ncbi:MAG: hypothetical protein COB59_10780 [Rhodospirillaceae bacterium]|nr:MAG: hypothetical protein COB59_10780 [Rhodospirillaceae bacterium]
MIDYRVRSISLLNLVNDIHNEKLVPDAYFQRNLVWREVHNKDFIQTILLGFPFPQIFISKGKIDVETMSTVSCIVDGQQRTNAITQYIDGAFDVDGKRFQDLTEDQKSAFLKYEIAVIELDLDNNDPKVKDIFQRINRTSNSLSTIEKMASEYATSYFMLTAKLLADQIDLNCIDTDNFKEDPNIPPAFFIWARDQKITKFKQLITSKGIFTARELSKKAHLMHVLNIMSTLHNGFYNRNEKMIENLDSYSQEFEEKDDLIALMEVTAEFILSMKFHKKSYWYNKSNIFTLFVIFGNATRDGIDLDAISCKQKLEAFEIDLDESYKLAAKEAVNGRKERQHRHNRLLEILGLE